MLETLLEVVGVLHQERKINSSLKPKSGRSGFGLVAISALLAGMVILLEHRTLRDFKL